MTDHQYQELRQAIRDYHDDVKRRLELMEDQGREHHVAIHGIAGDDTAPGLNVEVQALRGFHDRVRVGLGGAWAALLAIGSVLWARR